MTTTEAVTASPPKPKRPDDVMVGLVPAGEAWPRLLAAAEGTPLERRHASEAIFYRVMAILRSPVTPDDAVDWFDANGRFASLMGLGGHGELEQRHRVLGQVIEWNIQFDENKPEDEVVETHAALLDLIASREGPTSAREIAAATGRSELSTMRHVHILVLRRLVALASAGPLGSVSLTGSGRSALAARGKQPAR